MSRTGENVLLQGRLGLTESVAHLGGSRRSADVMGEGEENMIGAKQHPRRLRLTTLSGEPDVVLVVIDSPTTVVADPCAVVVIPTRMAENYWVHPS